MINSLVIVRSFAFSLYYAPPLNPLLTLGDHDPDSIAVLVAYVRKRTGLPLYAEDKIRDLIKSRHGDFRTKFLQGYSFYSIIYFCFR